VNHTIKAIGDWLRIKACFKHGMFKYSCFNIINSIRGDGNEPVSGYSEMREYSETGWLDSWASPAFIAQGRCSITSLTVL
jgi:hypothetical protein